MIKLVVTYQKKVDVTLEHYLTNGELEDFRERWHFDDAAWADFLENPEDYTNMLFKHFDSREPDYIDEEEDFTYSRPEYEVHSR